MFAASKVAGASAAAANYIEDVFSTYLYVGNGTGQTINNGIDESGKGALTWIKGRATAYDNYLFDTARGNGAWLISNTTAAQLVNTSTMPDFASNGFTLKTNTGTNASGQTYVSWTFRKQAKFFDVVTYTGTGANRTIAHNLGSTPGCIIVKRTDTTGNWQVYHNGLSSAANSILLNSSGAQASAPTVWNSTAPTSTVFSVGTDATVNASGGTYVAYVLAHNAGGFGLTGTDNVISCGSFTTDGSGNATVNLGYEPQFLITKITNASGSWRMMDVLRNMSGSNTNFLYANLSNAEGVNGFAIATPNPTGFNIVGESLSSNYIYIAIRRGPMKTPTSGTSVFSPITANAAAGTQQTTGFPVDMQIATGRGAGYDPAVMDRLRYLSSNSTQVAGALLTDATNSESVSASWGVNWGNTGFGIPNAFASTSSIFWNFCRAPGFMDVVCYTGNGTAGASVTHGLGAKPLLNFIKKRNVNAGWIVYTDVVDGSLDYMALNTTAAKLDSAESPPTSSVFYLSNGTNVNNAGDTYVSYTFGSVPGVSSVGKYTGNGTSQTINCGFSAGARFILIKRWDSTGDWYVWDTARGIVSANDPHLSLNTTAAEVTTDDSVDPANSGFIVNQVAATNINVNAATYIYLAIA